MPRFFRFGLINSIVSPGQAAVRETGGKIARETRFWFTPLAFPARARGPVARARPAVENGLPWVMDMVFRDAECRLSKDRAPGKAPCVSVKPSGRRLPRKPRRGMIRSPGSPGWIKQDSCVFTSSYPMGPRGGLARGGLA